MKTIYCTSALILLAGCGKQQVPAVVDPALTPYLSSFTQNIGADTSDISAQFADTENNPVPLGEEIGDCQLSSDNDGNIVSRSIQIDSGYWAKASDDQREQLMYHELGHCALLIGHTPGYLTTSNMNDCPISIMDPYAFNSAQIWCYTQNKDYYYQEIKTHPPTL